MPNSKDQDLWAWFASYRIITLHAMCCAAALLHCSFDPPMRYAPFTLAPRLCYASALESAASTVEVAAIAGRNCALLLARQLSQHHTHTQQAAVPGPMLPAAATS